MPKNKFITSWAEVPICVDVPYVCMMLGMSYDGILRMIRRNAIKAVKIGREYRIIKTELQRILNEDMDEE